MHGEGGRGGACRGAGTKSLALVLVVLPAVLTVFGSGVGTVEPAVIAVAAAPVVVFLVRRYRSGPDN